MAKKPLPSPEVLRQLLRYEPDAGTFFWKERDASMFPTIGSSRVWNARFSGKEAFTSTNFHGYKQTSLLGWKVKAHRVAWAIHFGAWPESPIDHINGDRADNRISNLRTVTVAENGQNMKRTARNTSGVVGVTYNKKSKRWKAYIGSDPILFLGHFIDFREAVDARKKAEIEHGYHANHGR